MLVTPSRRDSRCRPTRRVATVLLLVSPVALVLLARPGLASAGDRSAPDTAKSVFERRYAAMKSAMADRDPKAMAALLAEDFRSEDVTGKTTTASQMLQQVSALPKDPMKRSETTVLAVQMSGNSATVRQRYHMTTTKLGPDGAASQAVELVALSTDTWIRMNGAWLLQRTVTDQLDYMVDGRVVAHRERSGGN